MDMKSAPTSPPTGPIAGPSRKESPNYVMESIYLPQNTAMRPRGAANRS